MTIHKASRLIRTFDIEATQKNFETEAPISALIKQAGTSWLLTIRVVLAVCLGLTTWSHASSAAGLEMRLEWTNSPGGATVSWNSPSLTPTSPFVHYEFQVQHSANLTAWENAVLIPGGFLSSASVNRTFRLPATNAQGFVRLSYRLNMPGANLNGLDLSGADLRGANLAGANLSGTSLDGALLGGADLTGANLSGATFAGANLQDVNLTGFDLSSLDLSTILGMPSLTQVTANPLGSAAQLVPNLPYNSDGSDLVANDPVVPGAVSTRHAMLMLKTNATIGQLNALLATHGASIVASSPADATLPGALLMARFSTTSAQELFDLTVALNNDPIVETAAPDVLLGLNAITDDTSAAPGWTWDLFGLHAGGNWGLEKARVPQMWNVYGALQNKGAARVPTCIIDDLFYNHTDLSFTAVFHTFHSLSNLLQPSDHGNHVAGIVGATYGNRFGIDGINPLASLSGFEFRSLQGYSLVQDVREALRQFPDTRIINMSLGYNWYQSTNALRPTYSSPFTAEQLDHMEFIALRYGLPMLAVARSSSSVLIVCAAGNDNNLIGARLNSPMCTAALDYGAPNILVVGSHDMNGLLSLFSNSGGHVAAPGESILSSGGASPTNHAVLRGTSMASPFVAGVAGFLKAVAPTLTPAEVITLIQKSQPNVDAYTSLLEIDKLPSRQATHDREVLKMLLDIDDGSLDGSLRVEVEEATLGNDRAFELVAGIDFDNNNLVPGDGVIDMSDFRRWRDWLLYGEGGHALNGSRTHLKFDANANGTAHEHDDSQLYPRGDFNGDGVIDKLMERPVPGWLLNLSLTDLEVLMFSDLWEDECFPFVLELPSLIDSADFTVSAENVFAKYGPLADKVKISAYDAATRAALPKGTICLSNAEPVGVLTIPVGGPYYVASEPIPMGDGTNVMMRSIGEKTVLDSQRGADFAVDLTLLEMTAVASTANPVGRDIDSQPNTNQVDAYLGTQPDEPPAQETVGARARANEEATLYSIASAGSLPVLPNNPTNTTYASGVRWQRSFTKDIAQRDPRFLLKSLNIELFGFGAGTDELRAFAEIIMEIRAYDRSPEWEPIFTNLVEIAGKGASGGLPATFRIVRDEGGFPHKDLEPIGDQGVKYEQKGRRTRIDLDGIDNGHSFELRYQLNTWVMGGALGDNGVLARLGDPVQFASGLRMNFGAFGELPYIKRVSPAAQAVGAGIFQAASQAPVLVEYLSKTNFYYRLYRGADADTSGMPFAMKLGIDGDDSMIDPTPLLPNPTEDDYTLENQPIDQPLDFDADGIDDVYELRHPAILDPLNSADAFLDPDGDGRSNLEEYQDGTDPQTPDSPPTNPTLNFPGLLVPSYPGGALIDINNDGLLDSAVRGLSISLAHLGGTFDAPITSPLTDIRIMSDTVYVKLDGDAFPDAVVIDILTNRVFTYRGVGDGTFTTLTNYPAIGSPNLIALCNLNGDALKDIAIFSENGRGVDLHLNNGDGTLTRTTTITTNAYGSGNSFAMADLNNDSRDDIIVGYAFNAVVFLSQPNGSYAPAQPYPVGSFPEAISAGDLNHDGRPDLVVANSGSDDLSVLIASAPGVFSPHVRYPVGDNPRGLRLADLNGDTHLDAVVSLPSADYQIILPGLGNGAFGPLYTVPAGNSLADIRDWNGDGKLDLVSTVSSLGGLINFGNGDGTFDTRLQIVPTNPPPTEVTAVDFNGDGKLELVGLQTQRNSIDVWEHAAVHGTNRLRASFVVGPYVQAFTHGDFNRDGLMDLAVATGTNSGPVRGSNQVVVLTNQGNFTFVEAGHYPLAFKPDRIVSADFNGDTHADLTVLTQGGTLNGGSRLIALPGDGSGGFQARPPVEVATTIAVFEMGDVDGDGQTELVLAGVRLAGSVLSGFTELYDLDDTNWSSRQSLVFSNNVGSLKIQSLNGDTYADMVTTEIDGASGVTTLGLYPGGPTGLGARQALATGVTFQSFSHIADLNNDGLHDIIGFNTLYLAKPDGGFHPGQTVWIGAEGVQHVADFNRDGKPDLLNGLSILLQK